MGKKMLAIIFVVVFALTPFKISEATQSELCDSIIGPIPLFSFISSTSTVLTISSSGTATSTGLVRGYQGTTTKVVIYLYLQQYKNGTWVNVGSWSQTHNNYYGTLSKTQNVTKGYDYRLKASYYAYSGTAYENTVSYSKTVKY